MTPKAFLESRHGINVESLPANEICKLMDEYANHKYEEWKARRSEFDSQKFMSERSFEEIRKRLPGK